MDKASTDPSAAAAQPENSVPFRPSLSLRPRPGNRAWIHPSTPTPTVVTGQEQGHQQPQHQQQPRSAVTASGSQHTLPSLPPTPPTPPTKSPSRTPLEPSSLESLSATTGTNSHVNPRRSNSSIQRPSPAPPRNHRYLLARDNTLPSIPPVPPPHDDTKAERDSLDSLDDNDKESQKPLPPLKSGAHAPPSRQKTFLIGFMDRHPWIRQHRRRFIAIVFVGIFFLITLIVLLAVLLPSNGHDDDDNFGLPGGGGGGSGGSGDYDDDIYHTGLKDKKKLADLKKFNKGKEPPPVNMADSSGWTNSGSGDGTYYDPALRTPVGFQMGACEFEYVNSPKDMIAALNHIDFRASLYPRKRDSPACGQCLRVQGPTGSVTVQVVDVCPGCKSGDLDLAPGAFAKIAEIPQGRVPITWTRCTAAQASALDVEG
ncbi:hypothetical protein BGZ73_003359 [Actinomortierella ambigua]|nr:hypothetical protein BGZ73_003359 [Actinomortierella ambigua]